MSHISRALSIAGLALATLAWASGLPSPIYNTSLILALILIGVTFQRATSWEVAANLGLAFCCALGALLGCDLTLRVLGTLDRVPQDVLLRRDPAYPSLSRYLPGGRFSRRRPGTLQLMRGGPTAGEGYHQDFLVDGRGFRNPPDASTRPIEVLVLGDSFAEGGVVSQEVMWPELLRKSSARSVYCSAISGSSPWMQLMTAKLWTRDLEFASDRRVIWMLFGGNDLTEHYGEGVETPDPLGIAGQWRARWETFRKRSPLRRLWSGLASSCTRGGESPLVPEVRLPDGQTTFFFRPHIEMVRRDAGQVRGLPRYQAFRQVFREMIRFLRGRDLRPLIVRAPSKEEIYWQMLFPEESVPPPIGFRDVVAKLSAEEAVEFLDLAPALSDAAADLWQREKKLLYFHDDTHWNEAGNAAVAQIIRNGLNRHGRGATRAEEILPSTGRIQPAL